jgi:hypothetical protein
VRPDPCASESGWQQTPLKMLAFGQHSPLMQDCFLVQQFVPQIVIPAGHRHAPPPGATVCSFPQQAAVELLNVQRVSGGQQTPPPAAGGKPAFGCGLQRSPLHGTHSAWNGRQWHCWSGKQQSWKSRP